MPRPSRTIAKKRGGRSTPARRNGGGAGKFILAFILGIGVAAAAGYLYLHSRAPRPAASVPAEIAPPPATHTKLTAPAAAPPKSAPFGTSEDVFEAGARHYSARCASCHGTPARDAATTPQAQQFWRKGRHTAAAQAPGELYAEISAGAPAKGMPAYTHTLTDTQIWQLALLLKNADQDLPDPVLKLLNTHEGSSAASR